MKPRERDPELERRTFLKAGTGAGAWLVAGGPLGAGAAVRAPRRRSRATPPPPPNQLAPAVQFQANPGGTGAWLARQESLEPPPIAVRPWRGERPATAEEIAFLPVHAGHRPVRDDAR